jgi:hypothetical protein
MKRALKWLGIGVVGLALIAALAYATRSNPIGPLAGRELTGEVVTTAITDWSFTDEHPLIAVETRPAAPHSVTVICFSHDGALYVPARGGSAKDWPHFAVSDPRVRVKIGDKVYPALATRVEDPELRRVLIAAAAGKYDFEGPQEPGGLDDVWVFQIESAPPEVAAAPM